MTPTRKTPGGAGTFLRFAWQQLRNRKAIRESFNGLPNFAGIAPALRALPKGAPQVATLTVPATDAGWRRAGLTLRKGQSFSVFADGAVWISQPMSVGASAVTALWLRIAKTAPLRKMRANASTFEAWADGELEFCLKPPGEWANENGDFDPAVPRAGASGAIEAVVALWPGAAEAGLAALARSGLRLPAATNRAAPTGWSYLWRLGEGSIYATADDAGKPCIHIHTHGDVGILQYPVAVPLDQDTTLEWRWRVDQLPSVLPEHVQPTHDYLSIAVEFENGQDLTYFWSNELPVDTVFKCPLPWWSSRETHWVVRSGREGLGQWLSERRSLKSDYEQAIGGTMPSRVVGVWLIANSVFQRRHGEALFADIALSVGGARRQVV